MAKRSDEALAKAAQAGDSRAEEELLGRYKGHVRLRAKAYYILGADKEDVVQEGMIGLFKAVHGFEPGSGASFATFASVCIDRQIQDAIKACGLENEDDVVKNAFIAGIKYGDQSGKAMAHDSVSGYSDALDAYDMITAEVKERMNAIAEAAEDVKGVLGKIKATAYDAAEEVYLDACKQLGINCNRLTARDAFMAYNAGHKKQLATDSKPAAPAKQTILGSVLDRVRID